MLGTPEVSARARGSAATITADAPSTAAPMLFIALFSRVRHFGREAPEMKGADVDYPSRTFVADMVSSSTRAKFR